VGAVEAGGTKFVCAVGTGPDDVRDVTRFPTTGPEETLDRTLDFLRRHVRDGALAAVGIGSFGPVDVDPDSPTWGHVTSTPKEGWSDTEFAPRVRRELGVPVGFDTDVNAAALGEGRWGAARGLDTFAYVTVGTGIGGGGMVEGRLLHGLLHPEMGHIRIPREADDDFPGICPFHGDCLEGLATGPALEARWGRPAAELPDDHPAWELEARHLAHGLVNLTLVLSPERIVVGGGVMKRRSLYPAVRREMTDLLAGYLRAPEVLEGMDRYVVPPGLGDRAGVLGAMALGKRAARRG
jgi:fructokinase